MKIRQYSIGFIILSLIFSLSCSSGKKQEIITKPQPEPTVTDTTESHDYEPVYDSSRLVVRAFLIYENGQRSGVELFTDMRNLKLWNVPKGDGSPAGRSSKTLIIIEAASETKSRKLDITIQDASGIKLQKTEIFSPTRKALEYAIDCTGCSPLTITVRESGVLIDEKTIPFRCEKTVDESVCK